MPHYEYLCHSCKNAFSKVLTLAEYEEGKVACPQCGRRRSGTKLVRVEQVQYRWNAHKPFYTVRFQVVRRTFLYCTSSVLWKLSWFVRDFSYAASHLTAKSR